MSAGKKRYPVVHLPNGTVTGLIVSEELIRQLIAEYRAEGWRVMRCGDVVILHSQEAAPPPSTEKSRTVHTEKTGWRDITRDNTTSSRRHPDGCGKLELASANILSLWQNGHNIPQEVFRDLSAALHLYRLERDANMEVSQ